MSKSSQEFSDVWVLLSGGIDSTACVEFYMQLGARVSGFFVDYQQVAAVREWQAAEAISNHYHVSIEKLTLAGFQPSLQGMIFGRNAFLLFAVLMNVGHKSGSIALGIHSDALYYDCSSSFVDCIQPIVEEYTDGRIRLATPFLSWGKRQVWDFCIANDVPLSLTYSCELGLRQPCGRCLSCKELEALRAS